MPKEETAPAEPEEILAKIQRGLKHAQAEERLTSIEALGALTYSNRVVLLQLEKMAIDDRSKAVRAAAFEVL